MRTRVVLAALILSGCAYDPPLKTDHTLPRYQSDLAKCQREAQIKADQIAGRTPFTEIASIFTSNEPQRQNVRTCMQSRGYSL